MAYDAGSIIVKFQSDLSGFNKGIEQAQGTIATLGQNLVKVGAIATAALTVPLIGVGIGAIKAAAGFEQSTVAFETMLGSAEKAKKLLNDLVAFAMKTPFELTQVETGAKQLLAYGISADKVLVNLQQLGDIASGVGMDKLPNLIMAFGQVKAATRLTGMELRQFTEAGVPLLEELAKVMKKPVKEVQDLVSKGEVGFPIVEKALANLTGESGRFHDLMQKQSKTTLGQWSNLMDNINKTLRILGQNLLPAANSFVQFFNSLLEKLQKMNPEQAKWVVIIGAIVAALGPFLIILGTLINSMIVVGGAIAAVGGVLATISLPVLAVIAAIVALIAIGYLLIKHWDDIKAAIGTFVTAIQTQLTALWTTYVQPILTMIGNAFMAMWTLFIKPAIDNVIAHIMFWYNMFSWIWNNLLYPILLLISAIFLRIFYEIWQFIKWASDEINKTITTVWNAIWAFLEPILNKIKDFVVSIWNTLVGATKNAWNWIKQNIITPITEAYDTAVSIAQKIFSGLQDKFNAVLAYVRDVWNKVKEAIVRPFEDAKNAIEGIARRIKEVAEQISPFHKSSPSLVELVEKGVGKIKAAYASLDFDVSPVAHTFMGTGAQGMTAAPAYSINIDMSNAVITDNYGAQRMGELMGDEIIKKLQRNIRI